jgi:hypothetical protein
LLTVPLTLSRLWGGATVQYVQCLRWWGKSNGVLGFVSCLVALVSGMLWSRSEYGGYWYNDPVEFGAVAMVLWTGFAILYFGRRRVPSRLDLAFGIAGNIVMGLSWFVAATIGPTMSNMPRPHSREMPASWTWFLVGYFAIHIALLALALVPIRHRDSDPAEAIV